MNWVRARCDTSACVEVADTERGVAVRSSLRPDEWLDFSTEEWATFLEGVKRGDFEGATVGPD